VGQEVETDVWHDSMEREQGRRKHGTSKFGIWEICVKFTPKHISDDGSALKRDIDISATSDDGGGNQ